MKNSEGFSIHFLSFLDSNFMKESFLYKRKSYARLNFKNSPLIFIFNRFKKKKKSIHESSLNHSRLGMSISKGWRG